MNELRVLTFCFIRDMNYHLTGQNVTLCRWLQFHINVFCLLNICMFVLFLLLATWLLSQHINKAELNSIELKWTELLIVVVVSTAMDDSLSTIDTATGQEPVLIGKSVKLSISVKHVSFYHTQQKGYMPIKYRNRGSQRLPQKPRINQGVCKRPSQAGWNYKPTESSTVKCGHWSRLHRLVRLCAPVNVRTDVKSLSPWPIDWTPYDASVAQAKATQFCSYCAERLHPEHETLGLLIIPSTVYKNLLSFSLLSKNVNIKIHRTMILPVVLYGCEIWSLVLENRVLRRIFGHKRDEVTGE
jgi:hypothetical protein